MTEGGAAFENVAADGMAWAGGDTLFYAENDAFVPGSNGILYRIDFETPTRGTVTVVRDRLKDPSGVYVATISGAQYILVAESQYGHLFGLDAGDPAIPFLVHAIPVVE